MKIDFLVTKDIFKGGGIEKYSREVGRRLVARGHDVTVYSTTGDGPKEQSLEGMRIVWLPKVRPYWAEKLAAAGHATILELGTRSPDVIHLHSVAAGAMAAVLKWRKVPRVVQMHGVEWQRNRWPKIGRALLKGLEQASFGNGSIFTAVSQTQCDYYTKKYGVPVRFIPTAADLKSLVSASLMQHFSFQPMHYVLSASRLVPEKGIHYLIEAYKRLNTDWHLVILGDHCGEEEYFRILKRLAADDPKIHFLGFVNGRLLDELFSNAGLYVQPSEIEGMAIALLEAMGFGIPCLVSDIPENLEAIGDAGLMFRSKNVDDLASVLGLALNNPTVIESLGAKARDRVAKFYTWDRVTDALEELYFEAIQSPIRTSCAQMKDDDDVVTAFHSNAKPTPLER